MTAALWRSTTINEEGVMAALRNIYWLAKEDVASLKYTCTSLNALTKLQGCDIITHLYVGENAKYTSPEVVKEMQLALIIPVSSAPCERGFSATNRIKTKLRNHLQISTVDTLLRISVEGPPIGQFDFSHALDKYKHSRQHRIFNK